MRSALLPIVASALAGCLLDLPEVSDEGAHVVIAADPGLDLCAGSIAHMDAFVAALSDAFALAPPAGEDRFTFYWLTPEGFHDRTLCPREASACAYFGKSFTPYAPHDHELVHNVAEAFGYPRPIFTEGLAVAFEGLADGAPDEGHGLLDVRGLLGFTTGVQLGRAGGYPTAGAFTGFLIQRHGLEAYLRMYAAVGPLESEGGIDTIFREELGASLDESIAEFEQEPPCTRPARDAKLVECSAPALEWAGDRLTLHRAIACEQEDAVGPFTSGSAIVFYTVEIAEAGDYAIAVLGDDPANRVSLQPCTICSDDGVAVDAGEPPRTFALAAGRHSVRLHGPTDTRTSVGLRIERVGP